MGEWSKKIGEYGENVVERFLSVIGWNNPAKGIQIDCLRINGDHMNDSGKPVHSHGIDFLYTYKNPLADGQLCSIIISSKYKTEKYPNSPTKLFKWFMTDLMNQVECYANSSLKYESQKDFRCQSINDIGVLFWLNNQSDSEDDLISKVSSARLDIAGNQTIYIVDNKRAGFILKVMQYLQSQSAYDYSFYYPSTGRNINPCNRTNTGPILPVEYLNSSILPIKMVKKDNNNETCFMLATLDDFEKGTFMRLIGLAKDISTNLPGHIVIGFPDYNSLTHGITVTQTKMGFDDSDFTKIVSVINYTDTLNIF